MNNDSLEEKTKVIELFQPFLNKLPASTLKDSILTKLANAFARGNEKRLDELRKKNADPKKINSVKQQTKVTPVRIAIALLLEHPHIVNALPDISVLAHLEIPGIALLNQLLQLCQQNPQANSAQLLENFRDTAEGKQLEKLMCWQHDTAEDAAEDVFLDNIEKLLNSFVEQRIEVLLQKASSKEISKPEMQELQMLLNA